MRARVERLTYVNICNHLLIVISFLLFTIGVWVVVPAYLLWDSYQVLDSAIARTPLLSPAIINSPNGKSMSPRRGRSITSTSPVRTLTPKRTRSIKKE